MPSLTALRDGLATRLETITGLRVFAEVPDAITPPVAVIRPSDSTFITFDTTFARGSDDYAFLVTLIVSRASERAGQQQLDAYLAGEGAGSVKVALDGDETLGGIADWCHLAEARAYGRLRYNDIEYFGCELVISVAA